MRTSKGMGLVQELTGRAIEAWRRVAAPALSMRTAGGFRSLLRAGGHGRALALDDGISTAVAAWRPRLDGPLSIITRLAAPQVVLPVSLLSSAALFALGRRKDAAFVSCTVGGAMLLDAVLKPILHRQRPGARFDYRFASPPSYSSPSGHTVAVTSLSLSLAEVMQRSEPPRLTRNMTRAASMIAPALVATSRIYFGLHYPSDALGATLLANGWARLMKRVFYGEESVLVAEASR